MGSFFEKTGRGLAVAVAMLAAIGLTTVPRPADAGGGWGGGGISPGAAVGLGLGAFALGSVLSQPYYNPYYSLVQLLWVLPICPSLLPTGGVLSARAELLEPLLPLLLRLLSGGRPPVLAPERVLRQTDFRPRKLSCRHGYG